MNAEMVAVPKHVLEELIKETRRYSKLNHGYDCPSSDELNSNARNIAQFMDANLPCFESSLDMEAFTLSEKAIEAIYVSIWATCPNSPLWDNKEHAFAFIRTLIPGLCKVF